MGYLKRNKLSNWDETLVNPSVWLWNLLVTDTVDCWGIEI